MKNNRVVIITGNTFHEVSEIKSSMENSFSGNGRYCNAIFLSVSDRIPEEQKMIVKEMLKKEKHDSN